MCECLGNIYRIESCRLLRNAIRICSGASSDHQPLTAARNLPSLSLFSPCQTGITSRHIKNRNHMTAHQTVTRGLCLSFCWRLIICCSPSRRCPAPRASLDTARWRRTAAPPQASLWLRRANAMFTRVSWRVATFPCKVSGP